MAKKKSGAVEMQNAIKTLLANIRFSSVDKPIKSIVMTSAVPNEGKSTISCELARAMADSGKRVLLVDADMRRRNLASKIGVHPAHGVYAVLSGEVSFKEAVAPTSVPNLFFLDAEPHIPNPADILASQAFAKLVSRLEEIFDYVVFDMPPVGTFIDAAILGSIVDGVVITARMGSVKRADIYDAVEQLRKADCNIIGVCANFCEMTKSDYYYSYYYSKGKNKEKKAKASFAEEG